MNGPATLAIHDVTVRFEGLVANADVSFSVAPGSISALIGPNGAGKSTLFNVVTGAITPTAGRLELDGLDITPLSTKRRAELGIARTFQSLLLVDSLTALDNVVVGAARMGRFARFARPGSLSGPDLRRIAMRALDFVGVSHRAQQLVDGMPFGDRRRVELARALASAPRLMLLDEPASGLPEDETLELIDIIRRIRAELGATVLVVEHDMSFVRAVAERTVVLDFGTVLAAGPTREVLEDERVVAAYLGGANRAQRDRRRATSRSQRAPAKGAERRTRRPAGSAR